MGTSGRPNASKSTLLNEVLEVERRRINKVRLRRRAAVGQEEEA